MELIILVLLLYHEVGETERKKEEGRKLKLQKPRRGEHKHMKEQEELDDIYRYLVNTRWQTSEPNKRMLFPSHVMSVKFFLPLASKP